MLSGSLQGLMWCIVFIILDAIQRMSQPLAEFHFAKKVLIKQVRVCGSELFRWQ